MGRPWPFLHAGEVMPSSGECVKISSTGEGKLITRILEASKPVDDLASGVIQTWNALKPQRSAKFYKQQRSRKFNKLNTGVMEEGVESSQLAVLHPCNHLSTEALFVRLLAHHILASIYFVAYVFLAKIELRTQLILKICPKTTFAKMSLGQTLALLAYIINATRRDLKAFLPSLGPFFLFSFTWS